MSLFRYCLTTVLVAFALSLSAQEIHWMTWEEAVKANEADPKKIFVDVYTDWCGWCKKMDNTTFKDSSVIYMMNADFYAIKLNAEQKESIFWKDKEYKWVPHKRDGVNQLAYDLLNGQLSYPTYVIMDSSFARILVAPGYIESPDLIKELKFAAEDHYKKITWQQYKAKS
jgi:thioredoxin-related protein